MLQKQFVNDGIFMQEEVPAGKGGMAAILGMDAAEIDKNIEEFDTSSGGKL